MTKYNVNDLKDQLTDMIQSPEGRTPMYMPATLAVACRPSRHWFASMPGAKACGYKIFRFSFNVKVGRCETCEGDGVITY